MSSLKAKILHHIASGNESRFGPSYLVAEVRESCECSSEQVWEGLWELVSDGFLFVDPGNQSSDNWRWKLSSRGKKAVAEKDWLPDCVEGYLQRLAAEIPNLDSTVMVYLKEALLAFNAKCYLASAVMLGVATERVFIIVAGTFIRAHPETTGSLSNRIENENTSYYSRWLEFRKRLEPLKKELPKGWNDPLTMDAIGELIRQTRNSSAHPSGELLDRERIQVLLQIAPMYIKKMVKLADYFEEQANEQN